jgi:hypothetical protein
VDPKYWKTCPCDTNLIRPMTEEERAEVDAKLYRWLTPTDEALQERNYCVLKGWRLHAVCTIDFRGERRTVEYHSDHTLGDLVIKVEVYQDQSLETPGWKRDVTGMAIERYKKRTWYANDGSVAAVKVTHKVYDTPDKKMKEGRQRRTNVMDALKLSTVYLLAVTETGGDEAAAQAIGIPYVDAKNNLVSNYINQGSYQPLRDDVAVDTEEWLDNDCEAAGMPPGTTIRDVILSHLVGVDE